MRSRRRRSVPVSTAWRSPICLSSDLTMRSFGLILVISRPSDGCIAMRMTNGVDSTGAPNVQPSSINAVIRSGCAAAARSAK